MSLSLCMIVKNEEDTLARCLESVKDIVDEMIIVDTGSTDATLKIAESYGARTFFYKWDNSFARARNFSLEKASKDWILIMDADDELKSEDKDKVINLITDSNSKLNAYFGETLSYSGDTPDSNIYSNLNIRFIKNGKGYKFTGGIHEQIVPGIEDANKEGFLGIVDIKFYHYGYLKKTVDLKNKRKRNMEIIEQMLKENPNNCFMLYNMGVEYCAKGEYLEAINYLNKSYENFDPALGFGSKLILKMISCYEVLHKLDKCLALIEQGLKYYPRCTDFEFYRASIFYGQKKYSCAIESAKKCISIGEAPVFLREIKGVGTYRAYYLLGIIYFDIGDYDEAYICYDKALRLNSEFTDAIFKISEVMVIKNTPVDEMQKKFEGYFNGHNDEKKSLLLSKVFYIQNRFDIAYKYAEEAESFKKNLLKVWLYKGLYLFYQRNFKEALESLYKVNRGEGYNNSIYCSILCEIFNENYEQADKLLEITEKFNEPEETMVYKTFKDIIKENKYIKLADDKEISEKFVTPIFNLLEVLLRSNSFDEFKKAVQLLNLIDSDSIFMLLGKLYYKYGYFKFAYKEFIRSIKIYEKIDADALEMMKKILMCKAV